jgi:hypothetical protein
MAQRNPAARLALTIGILVVIAGIYMLWRHTQLMVERDARKKIDSTRIEGGR